MAAHLEAAVPPRAGVPLAALRQATAAAHARLEDALAVAAPGAGREDYLDYLQAMYGWMRPFDCALWAGEWPQEMHAAGRAGKLAWIEHDLRSAGLSAGEIGALPASAFAPDLSTRAARFGLAYVIEGSQLGTKSLRQRLDGQLDGIDSRWLQGYGPALAANWRAFLHALDTHVQTPQDIDEACIAAQAAFAALANWFELRSKAKAIITE